MGTMWTDGKSITHMPNPQIGSLHQCLQGPFLKSLHVEVGCNKGHGGTHCCSFYLLICQSHPQAACTAFPADVPVTEELLHDQKDAIWFQLLQVIMGRRSICQLHREGASSLTAQLGSLGISILAENGNCHHSARTTPGPYQHMASSNCTNS